MAKNWMEKTSDKIKKDSAKSQRAYDRLVSILQKKNTNLYDLKSCENWSNADKKEFLNAMIYEGYNKEWVKKVYRID